MTRYFGLSARGRHVALVLIPELDGKCGTMEYGISWRSSDDTAFAKLPNPEPHITPSFGLWRMAGTCFARYSALVVAYSMVLVLFVTIS